MLVQTSQGQSGSAHAVVLGNETGGAGQSTTALHIAVALMKACQRVATLDLDCRRQSSTRYIGNRSAWARRTGLDLEIPVHRCIKLGETMQIADNETSEFQQFMDAVSVVERSFDFIVIDTPGSDSYLMRLAHSMRSEEHTSELQSPCNLVCRLLLETPNQGILFCIVYR